MPGLDGTGPRGMGPMTGGGRGYCVLPLGPTTQQAPVNMPPMVRAPWALWGAWSYLNGFFHVPYLGMGPFGGRGGFGRGRAGGWGRARW